MREDLLTACARIGHDTPKLGASRPTSVPIVQSAAFSCDDLETLSGVQNGALPGFQYTRIKNPTTDAWERAIAHLEGGEAGLGFASGMAAIAAVLMAQLQAGDHLVLAEQLYGFTYAFVTQTLARYGVTASFVDAMDMDAVAAAMTAKTRLVYAETISNPTLSCADLPALADLAHAKGASLVVDNTFATPFLARPLSLGADIVLHSATKYLNGHSDVSAGVVVASRARISHIQKTAWLLGATLDPMASWLLLRGLKTLGVRFSRQCESARWLAERLRSDARVARVHHPGIGAVVSFEAAPRPGESRFAACERVVKGLDNIGVVASLGGVATTLTHPASTSHRALPVAVRERLGVTEGLLRLSVGLEDAATLLREIEGAL